jgi:steroid 5-alpha reductase family enzyme
VPQIGRLTPHADYQTAKHKYLADAKLPRGYDQASLDRGFNTSGLWAYSRHPNCTSEQLVWVTYYQWACYASGTRFNWALAGAGSLVLLFQSSTQLTESISSDKYPEYKNYQQQVPMFLPTSFRPYQGLAGKPKSN